MAEERNKFGSTDEKKQSLEEKFTPEQIQRIAENNIVQGEEMLKKCPDDPEYIQAFKKTLSWLFASQYVSAEAKRKLAELSSKLDESLNAATQSNKM